MASFRDRARVTNLARVEAIADALDRLRGGVLAEEVRLTARRAAHSLVGSAGTFGFGEASRSAARWRRYGRGRRHRGHPGQSQRGLELVEGLRGTLTGATGPEGQGHDGLPIVGPNR